MHCDLQNLGEALKFIAHRDPAAMAIVSTKYHPLSYSQLVWQIDHVEEVLRQNGFTASSRIAIAINEPVQAALVIVGISCSAVAMPLNQNLTPVETGIRLKRLKPDAMCLLAGDNNPARIIAKKYGIMILEIKPDNQRKLVFTLCSPLMPHDSNTVDKTLEGVAVLLQTSGTTAEPKLVPCSHSGLLATAARVQAWFKLNNNDRCLCIVPPYFSHGLKVTILAPLLSGGSVAFPESSTNINLQEWLETLRPTWYSASPTVHLAISEMLCSAPLGLHHHLRMAVSGGSQLPEKTRLDLEDLLGIPVFEHYGTTETSQVSSNIPSPGPHKSGTVGIPPPETVIVVGNDGNVLPSGEKGEILISGPTVMKGYLNGSEFDTSAFEQGWFHSGDIGSFDLDGYLTIHGRIKEVINRGGEKISPLEIESVLLSHPDVLEVAAFSVPHPRLGEDISAAVVLKKETVVTAEMLRRFMSAQISWSKIPRRFIFVDTLPKTQSGKVSRKQLSEIYS